MIKLVIILVVDYVKKGWHVSLAYVVGFFVLLATLGWNPHTPHKNTKPEIEKVSSNE